MDVVGPVFVKFKNRTTSFLEIASHSGAIPLEDMDVHSSIAKLIVNPDHLLWQ
ncbi:MAG: hypothetical protein IPP49_20620 [Saprospiraceae bacterium]|nr:hypothetical protein [Saprospiraceae bacterium]